MWWMITLTGMVAVTIYSYLRGWIGKREIQPVSIGILALPSLRELLRHSDQSLMFVAALAQLVFTAVLITMLIMRLQRAPSGAPPA